VTQPLAGPVLLGCLLCQAWEAATWGKQLSWPHTSAMFPWLHCVPAPEGLLPYQQSPELPLPAPWQPLPWSPAAAYR
jgi:hypothetical protein